MRERERERETSYVKKCTKYEIYNALCNAPKKSEVMKK